MSLNPYELAVVLMGAFVGSYVFGLAKDMKQKHSPVAPECLKAEFKKPNVIPITKKDKRPPRVNDDEKAFKAENPDNYPRT